MSPSALVVESARPSNLPVEITDALLDGRGALIGAEAEELIDCEKSEAAFSAGTFTAEMARPLAGGLANPYEFPLARPLNRTSCSLNVSTDAEGYPES